MVGRMARSVRRLTEVQYSYDTAPKFCIYVPQGKGSNSSLWNIQNLQEI